MNEDRIEELFELDYYPSISEDEIKTDEYMKIPFAELEAFGAAFASLPSAFRTASQSVQIAGVFQAKVPAGAHMVASKDGSGMLGACFDANNHLVGQARFTPVDAVQKVTTMPYDPSMMFVAAMLMRIERKLDVIHETQQQILKFLQRDKETKLEGDLKTLISIVNEYKFNWDNELFKNNNHKQVGDIKRAARQNILFYKKSIIDLMNKKEKIHSAKKMDDRMEKIQSDFQYYRLALYLFSFSSFLEALLLENHSSDYLQSVASKIKDLSTEYRKFYTKCYKKIERLADTTVESHVLDGAAKVNETVGHAIAKVPLIKKTPIDEALIGTGRKLSKLSDKKTDELLDDFDTNRKSGIYIFVENIRAMDQIFNQPKLVLLDDDAVYMKTYVA